MMAIIGIISVARGANVHQLIGLLLLLEDCGGSVILLQSG
jgi:hypothetical protein